MRFRKCRSIQIAVPAGMVTIKMNAIKSENGLWCIHRVIGNADLFTITHTPTGRNIGYGYNTLDEAKVVANRLDALDVNWKKAKVVGDKNNLSKKKVEMAKMCIGL